MQHTFRIPVPGLGYSVDIDAPAAILGFFNSHHPISI